MYIDVIGVILTVLIVSPKYWYVVMILSFADVMLTIFLSTTLQSRVTEVIAGGLFTTINDGSSFTYILGPSILLLAGIGMMKDRNIPWLDMINPLSSYRRPWPILMIKTSIFRFAIFAFLYGSK